MKFKSSEFFHLQPQDYFSGFVPEPSPYNQMYNYAYPNNDEDCNKDPHIGSGILQRKKYKSI